MNFMGLGVPIQSSCNSTGFQVCAIQDVLFPTPTDDRGRRHPTQESLTLFVQATPVHIVREE